VTGGRVEGEVTRIRLGASIKGPSSGLFVRIVTGAPVGDIASSLNLKS